MARKSRCARRRLTFDCRSQRTPDNLYPFENEVNQQIWNCSNFKGMLYGGGTSRIRGMPFAAEWHPFFPLFWNGTCEMGTLTQEGLEDSINHGKVQFGHP